MTARFFRTSAAALLVLALAACGSVAANKRASTRPSTPPRLVLAKSGARSASDAAGAPSAMPIRPQSYVLDGPLPELGTQSPVYRWTAHSIGLDDVNQLATAFGIHATAVSTADGFNVSDGDATLTVTTAGNAAQVSYYVGGPGSVGGSGVSGGSSGASSGDATAPPVPPDTPSTTAVPPRFAAPVDVPNADDATTIARALLDKAGVLAGQHWDSDVTDSGGIAISCTVGADCSTVPAEVTARDVTFHLVIGSVRVDGVTWTVTIGEHRRVESIKGEWGSAVELGAYDLRSTADAFTALKKGDTNFVGIGPVARGVPVKALAEPDIGTTGPSESRPIEVHVTGAALGLARWEAIDGDHNVVDLVPTYVFHTRIAGGEPSDVSVLALAPSAIHFATPIVPPEPVPEPGTVVPLPAPAPAPETAPTTKPAPNS